MMQIIVRRKRDHEKRTWKQKQSSKQRPGPDEKNGVLPVSICLLCAGTGAGTGRGKASAKSLCKAALDATGGSSYLTSQTTKAGDCPIFTVAQSKKISSIAYLCDDKEIYSICVVKAAKKTDASGLLKSIKAYQKNNSSSDYLGDYSQTEQNVFKNAVCGKKGQYVWYIAMSSKKDVNKKGQDALKKQL